MTEVSQKAIEGILTTINNWLDKAPDYVVELVHRYSMFYGISNMVWAFLWLLVIVVSIWIFKRFKKWCDKDLEWPMMSFWFLLCIWWIVAFIICVMECLKWFLVPEVVLLQHF